MQDHYKELYVEIVLKSKERLNADALKTLSTFLSHLDHEDFKCSILPVAEKSLLRNPEITLVCLKELLVSLTIDMSSYAVDLGRHLAVQCISKDEMNQTVAAEACRILAQQCTDLSCLKLLTQHFFKVLSGSEGKLTVVSQKINLLTAIGKMSSNVERGVAASVEELTTFVVDQFVAFVLNEGQETTATHAIQMMTLWSVKLRSSIPPSFTQWINKQLSNKSGSSNMRTHIFVCFNATVNVLKCKDLLPTFIQCLEKSISQPFQVSLVTEALLATNATLKILEGDFELATKQESFWSLVLDLDKQHFVNEKFLNQAPKEALIALCSVVAYLFNIWSDRLNDKHIKMYSAGLLNAAVKGDYEVKKLAVNKLKKIVSSADCRLYALAFVHELTGLLENIEKVLNLLLSSKVDCSTTTSNLKVLFDVLNVICSCSCDGDEDKMKMALETLVVSHHPEIVRRMPDPWMKLLKQLQIDPNIFYKKLSQQIEEKFNSAAELTPSQQNALTTLAMVTPTHTFDFLRRSVMKVFSNPEYLKVTLDEYALLNWPEGQLYDKSVIEAGVAPIIEKANIKRENKLYSYKEQLADIELKKELALKKNAKEEVKLTKKQQELMQAQLTKEANIRNLLRQLNADLLHTTSLIHCCTQANYQHARLSFHWLLPCIVHLFKSPLAAPHVTKIFIGLRSVAFDNHYSHLNETLAHNTLRLLKPNCYLEHNWSEEPLVSQSERVVDEMFMVTRCSLISSKQSFEQTFSCATFHYCYFSLEAILKLSLLDEVRLVKCLTIIKCHARKVGNADEDQHEDEHHPFHIPRLHIINLCLYVIGTSAVTLASHAHQTLIDTCHSCSGSRGLVSAPSSEEVQSLTDALLKPSSSVRKAALQALLVMKDVLPLSSFTSPAAARQLLVRLWIAKFDVDEENRVEAEELFEGLAVPNDRDFFEELASYVVHEETCVQVAASSAIALALQQHQQFLDYILKLIINYYDDKLFIAPPIKDQFGRIVKESPPDDYHSRHGIAMMLGKIASLLNQNTVEILFDFFVKKSLSDCNEEVRQEMLKSALLIINEHGKDNIGYLLGVFEDFLESAPVTASYDSVRQSVVIMMGTLAKHLDADHPKLKPIVGRLIATLATPSEQVVQTAAANCLPALVPSMKADAPDLVRDLMCRLLESEVYGERRGAAYGLAGMVKGLGILSLKQLGIISTITEALQDKKSLRRREGALFAFEMLCRMLERLFEPYVVHLLPHLLLCFGDNSQHIRDAADETAKVVMSKLSAHGVKLVLPSLLTALEEDSWRTKCGSVELLGAMAFCAPKQLSACLPNIVPKLTEVLSDSHQKVQKAGSQALKQIGSVIKNPEIQVVVPLLLEALQDPTKKTTVALRKLLDTKFIHFIDPPSLALIMPVVQRALSDRSTETRKMAAQIIGNMYSLTEPKGLSPYLPTMIPGLKQSLLNPMPEVRSASARAFGTMVKGIDDKSVDDLISWLMLTMTSESSTVDRSGAAQGLCEVLGGIGEHRLHSLMPDIIRIASRTDITPNVRDGYIMLYIYLPGAFNKVFVSYLGDVIPTILQALADETEYVRETALKAGQRIVNQYADTAIELLLPEVENGLFDENWRIRYSSVQLMGDLLFRISGVSGKMSTVGVDEDDNFGSETSQKAILAALGPERHNRVFAGLYICRQDSSLSVRQAALHVWKVIVIHTPRMLKDIMSTLFHLLLGCLASQSPDKRQVAARTLGDIVKKLGEKVLPEIIPILEKGLDSEDCDRRQGVCIGLSEIINSTSKDHVMAFADSLIPTVQKALCDPLPSVRIAAAKTFDTLHTNLGPRTLDDILPNLLKKLEHEEISEYALDGLKQVMAVKSRVVLPYLVPQLTVPPVNTRALSFLCSVAGDALTKHLPKILPAMMSSLAKKMQTPDEVQESQYCKSVVLSLQEESAVRFGMEVLIGGATNERAPVGSRVASLNTLVVFCEQSKVDYSEFIPQLLRALIPLAAEQDSEIINSSWDCLNAIVKRLDASNMIQYISHIRQAVRFAVNDIKDDQELPGFSIPKKGAAPLMTILREGVLNGGPEVKESASIGLTEIIKRTNTEALRPSVVNVTGALIRILGDRFSFNVKVAMLDTINLLLAKCETNLRPFLPQLQTTFVKSLIDVNRTVRLKSALALGKVISIHNRIDALFTELITCCKTAEDTSIRDTVIYAMRLCLINPSCKLSEKTQKEILIFLESNSNSSEDSTRLLASACQGALCCVVETELMNTIILSCIDSEPSQDWTVRYNKVTTLSVALKEAGGKILTKLNNDVNVKVTKSLVSYFNTDRIPICLAALRATAFYLRQQLMLGTSLDESLNNLLVKSMKLESNDLKQLCAQIMSYLCHVTPERAFDVSSLKIFVPMLLSGCREKNAAVKSFSEHALLAVLKYKQDESIYQKCLEFLEENSKETLTEVTNKILKKLAAQPEGIEEDIDVTILK
ncbi:hypothetical protein HELRODRAFT_107160 [Helobdella robusta]|uniref:TOG domain-containing protein n=1 Tax=Helobdella robusta TaxID=6412 RepID=T1EE81_HELRO|nr:hypothetical protein HELRODRAFT_107160 [Helobdella robusta]ESN99099.1 hypothetical protein HELRODRAFT_107160 [Helobdella robusta]